jgi:hypothetical protein
VTPVKDFGLPMQTVSGMVVDDMRLYALALVGTQVQVNIYNLSNVGPGAMPDAVLTKGLPAMNAQPTDIVLANDTLAVAYNAAASSGVTIFTGAKSAGNQSQGVALTPNTILGLRLKISTKTGLLYVAGAYNGNPAVTVWKNITSTPTLQATITSVGASNVSAIALYEP